MTIHTPVVLQEKSEGQVIKRLVGVSDALNVRDGNSETVGLQASGSWQRYFTRSASPVMAATCTVAIMDCISRDC